MPGAGKRRLGVSTLGWIAAVGLVAACGGGTGPASVPTLRLETAAFSHVVPAEGTLEAARSTALNLPPKMGWNGTIAWLAEDGAFVRAGEPVIRLDPSALEEQVDEASSELETARLDGARQEAEAESRINGLERDAASARLELDVAQEFARRDETLFSRREIIESEIDGELSERRLRHAQSTQRVETRSSRTELELTELRQRTAGRQLDEARDALAALEVVAPHDGIFSVRRSRNREPFAVGDQVFRGQPLAEIPDLSAMRAKVFVLEADAGGLAAGQKATVRIDAYPHLSFEATVRQVDKLARPANLGSPVQYFGVVLELATTDPNIMRPGQRVRADLHLGELEDALVIPRHALFQDENGQPVVYRRAGRGFEAVPVDLALAGIGRVAIQGDLKPGETIALADPTELGDEEAEPEDTPEAAASAPEDERAVRG